MKSDMYLKLDSLRRQAQEDVDNLKGQNDKIDSLAIRAKHIEVAIFGLAHDMNIEHVMSYLKSHQRGVDFVELFTHHPSADRLARLIVQ